MLPSARPPRGSTATCCDGAGSVIFGENMSRLCIDDCTSRPLGERPDCRALRKSQFDYDVALFAWCNAMTTIVFVLMVASARTYVTAVPRNRGGAYRGRPAGCAIGGGRQAQARRGRLYPRSLVFPAGERRGGPCTRCTLEREGAGGTRGRRGGGVLMFCIPWVTKGGRGGGSHCSRGFNPVCECACFRRFVYSVQVNVGRLLLGVV